MAAQTPISPVNLASASHKGRHLLEPDLYKVDFVLGALKGTDDPGMPSRDIHRRDGSPFREPFENEISDRVATVLSPSSYLPVRRLLKAGLRGAVAPTTRSAKMAERLAFRSRAAD